MNPFLVIGLFTVILTVVVYRLQKRQDIIDEEEPRIKPKREITVVKKADWLVDEKSKSETRPEPTIQPVEDPVLDPINDISNLLGIGPKFQKLLIASEVTSIKVIAESEPEELLRKLVEINESKKITIRNPTMYNIEQWIEAAKNY